jgi:hypothetical protein
VDLTGLASFVWTEVTARCISVVQALLGCRVQLHLPLFKIVNRRVVIETVVLHKITSNQHCG